jgi:hypothetical protein
MHRVQVLTEKGTPDNELVIREIPDPRVELEALSFVPRAAVAAATHPLAARSKAREPLTAPTSRTTFRSWSRTHRRGPRGGTSAYCLPEPGA